MIEKKSTGIIIGAMNLLAISVPMLGSQSLNVHFSDKKMEQVNHASIKFIESTWLKVPVACKARGFNASPVSLVAQEMASPIQSIYSLYQA